MILPFMLVECDQRDLGKNSAPTYIPEAFLVTLIVQPEVSHIIQGRSCSLLGEKLEMDVNARLL